MKDYHLTKNDIPLFELEDLRSLADDSEGYNHRELPDLGIVMYDKHSKELGCDEPGTCSVKIGEWDFIPSTTICHGTPVKLALPKVNGAPRLCLPFVENLSKQELKELLEKSGFFD